MPNAPGHHDHLMQIMGILNVTPDSFSDGGRYLDHAAAIQHGLQLIADGADMIDVGPESSRPGADSVSAEEQMRRAIPVIEGIRKTNANIAISIDTRSAEVATAAIDAGADIVNDISALRDDDGLAAIVAQRQCRVVLMHMQGDPATMQIDPTYQDVVEESIAFLKSRVAFARDAGVDASRIIVDPGVGFGKTTAHNLAIMHRLEAYRDLGVPVLLGASRKRFLDAINPGQTEPTERLGGSLACVARAMAAGIDIVRVHDVFETRQFISSLDRFDRPH